MIQITLFAMTKIKEISESEGIGHLTIRAMIKGGGCAGMVNDLYFEEVVKENDEVLELEDGIKLVIDPISFQYMEDLIIDYVESSFTSGFKFINPNVSNSCGCGKSFSV